MIPKQMTDEYKQAFLEQVCGVVGTHAIDLNTPSINQFLERLENLKEKAQTEGLKEENLFEILSYSPDDELEEEY